MRSFRVPFGRLLLVLLASIVLTRCKRAAPSPPPAPPVTLDSGLVVQDLRAGTGPEPAEGLYLAIHYDARIVAVDGVPRSDPPYDSTRAGEPFLAKFGKTPLLAGFAEGLRGMKEGGQRRLTIPPSLAYGATGKGSVPANATLEYVVDLVSVFSQRPSGLQFRVVAPGAGEPPRDGERVIVNWRAWLLETGREVSSSRGSGRPLEFDLGSGAALKGIEEALHSMSRGARWTVALPPELAYGTAGQWPALLPGEDVLFDLEYVGPRKR
jgi:FKBP-type peptidyl-prolyl cis-trans isomerase